jgi:hypothetical protein
LLREHDREYRGDAGNGDQRRWVDAVSCAKRD